MMAKMPDSVTVDLNIKGAKRAARLLRKAAKAAAKYARAKERAEDAVERMHFTIR